MTLRVFHDFGISRNLGSSPPVLAQLRFCTKKRVVYVEQKEINS